MRHPPHIAYQPEIDGLRMIAVLAVVLYHFSVSSMHGGFAGVDVFFVISGYLIGGLLWREYKHTGYISLGSFYKRRIRRLAPAFFAMCFAAAIAGWVILLPFEFREFGKSLIAATVYLSNVLFFRGEGYFDIGADNKVLLHTWSLSVEEQFYIFLPIVFLLLRRWRRLILVALTLSFAASLLSSLWITPRAQTAAFYLFPFRTWEMLTGVLLAIYAQERGPLRLRSWASWAGVCAVLASLFLIDAEAGFPGWQVIAPVLGTALLLANVQGSNPVNRFLSMRLPVFFGKISYSLYLWHWPIFTLSNYWRDGYSGVGETLLWIALSVILATISWKYIETPFRQQKQAGNPAIFGTLLAASTLALGFGALVYKLDGLPDRFEPQTRAHITASADFLQDWSRCERATNGAFAGIELCPIGPKGAPEVLIWGDSHVRAIKEGLELAAFEEGTPALIIWHAGCPPLFGVSKTESYATSAQDQACTTEKAQLQQAFNTLQVRDVLLVGRWAYYSAGTGIGLDQENTIQLKSDSATSGSGNTAAFTEGLTRTQVYFDERDVRVHILQQLPEFPNYDSREAARLLAHNRAPSEDVLQTAALQVSDLQARQAEAQAIFAKQQVIPTWDALCDASICHAIQNGTVWYFDNNHITNTAARALSTRFRPLMKGETQ